MSQEMDDALADAQQLRIASKNAAEAGYQGDRAAFAMRNGRKTAAYDFGVLAAHFAFNACPELCPR